MESADHQIRGPSRSVGIGSLAIITPRLWSSQNIKHAWWCNTPLCRRFREPGFDCTDICWFKFDLVSKFKHVPHGDWPLSSLLVGFECFWTNYFQEIQSWKIEMLQKPEQLQLWRTGEHKHHNKSQSLALQEFMEKVEGQTDQARIAKPFAELMVATYLGFLKSVLKSHWRLSKQCVTTLTTKMNLRSIWQCMTELTGIVLRTQRSVQYPVVREHEKCNGCKVRPGPCTRCTNTLL